MDDYHHGFIVGGLICAFAVGVAMYDKKVMPAIEKVQQGFVAPSDLEIECEDLDGNGEPETIERIKGTPYLLKWNENGRPVLLEYKMKPAEAYPKE